MSDSKAVSRHDLEKVIKDAKILYRKALRVSENKANKVQLQGQHLLENTLQSVQQAGDNALASGRIWAGKTVGFVRHNPWRSFTVAAGVAVILALLLKNK